MANHKDRPLINAKKNMHSTLTLVNVGVIADLTGWKVKGNQITDQSDMVQGVWDAKRSVTGSQAKELRLLLKCKTSPQTRVKTVDPPTGTVTITLENPPAKDQTITQQVDYANDDQPT